MTDSWLPPAKTAIRGLLAVVAAGSMSVLSWLGMDWLEGRAVLADHHRDIVALHQRADDMKARADQIEHGVDDLESHDHKVDLAIQKLTDLLEVHSEEIKDMKRRRRRDR